MTVPAPGAIDCDIHPALPGMQVLRAVSRRVLARARADARAGARQLQRRRLSAERADQLPARLEARRRATPAPTSTCCARRRSTGSARATPSATCCMARQAMFSEDLSAALCRAINDWLAAEWLRTRSAAARLHRRADAQPGACRARRSSGAPPIRASCRCWCGRWANCRWAAASTGRSIARPNASTCRSASTPAVQLSPSADQPRLAVVLPGRLRLVVHRVRRRAEQPDHRRRVRRVPAPEGRADGIRRDLAAGLDVARRQDLARRARRSAVAGEIARRRMRASMCA